MLADELNKMKMDMDTTVSEMVKAGLSGTEIAMTDVVLRNWFAQLILARHNKAEIEDVDEAQVAVISSALFFYLNMIMGRDQKDMMKDHLRNIMDDVAQRVKHQIKEIKPDATVN